MVQAPTATTSTRTLSYDAMLKRKGHRISSTMISILDAIGYLHSVQ